MTLARRDSWMPDVFNDFFDTDFMPRANATAPAINVKETEKDYTVEVAAPGLKKGDFNINLNDQGNLVIKMEKKNEAKDENKKEHYSKFEQTLLLPDDVDKEKIAANVSDGVLNIELPKIEKAAAKAARQIEVK